MVILIYSFLAYEKLTAEGRIQTLNHSDAIESTAFGNWQCSTEYSIKIHNIQCAQSLAKLYLIDCCYGKSLEVTYYINHWVNPHSMKSLITK